MITTQKIKRPTTVSPSLNLTQTANKCENGFFLRTIRFEILAIKHLKLKNMRSQQSEPYILTRKRKNAEWQLRGSASSYSDRKVVDLQFDSRTSNASLYPWERHFTRISQSCQSNLPVVVVQPDKILTKKNGALRWCG